MFYVRISEVDTQLSSVNVGPLHFVFW